MYCCRLLLGSNRRPYCTRGAEGFGDGRGVMIYPMFRIKLMSYTCDLGLVAGEQARICRRAAGLAPRPA